MASAKVATAASWVAKISDMAEAYAEAGAVRPSSRTFCRRGRCATMGRPGPVVGGSMAVDWSCPPGMSSAARSMLLLVVRPRRTM